LEVLVFSSRAERVVGNVSGAAARPYRVLGGSRLYFFSSRWVLADFSYDEKLTVMFWFFAVFSGMSFSVLREAEFAGG
jgi:hypothetical protein